MNYILLSGPLREEQVDMFIESAEQLFGYYYDIMNDAEDENSLRRIYWPRERSASDIVFFNREVETKRGRLVSKRKK